MTENIDSLDVLEQCPLAILILGAGKKVTWINKKLQSLVGDTNLVDKTQQQLQDQGLLWMFTTDEAQCITDANGQQRWIRCHYKSIKANYTAWYCQDITEFKNLQLECNQLHTDLLEHNGTDTLTGLLNRKALFQILEPQISRSRRYLNPLSIVLMVAKPFLSEAGKPDDLNGPSILALSQLLKDQMRWADQIGRISTAEFILILPETHFDDATKLIHKLDKGIERLNTQLTQTGSKISVYFGVSEWVKGDDSQRLIQRARDHINQG